MRKIHILLFCLVSLFSIVLSEFPDNGNLWIFMGCYKDESDRDLSGSDPNDITKNYVKNSTHMTHQYCFNVCKEWGYKYAGLQIGEECRCDNNYGKYEEITDGCTTTTKGNNIDKSGGGWENAVYRIGLGWNYEYTYQCNYTNTDNLVEVIAESPDQCEHQCKNTFSCNHFVVNIKSKKCWLKQGEFSESDLIIDSNLNHNFCGTIKRESRELIFPEEKVKAKLQFEGTNRGFIEFITESKNFGQYTDSTDVNPKFLAKLFGIKSGDIKYNWQLNSDFVLDLSKYYYTINLGVSSYVNTLSNDNKCYEPEKTVKLVEINGAKGVRTLDTSLIEQIKTGLSGKRSLVGSVITLNKIERGKLKGEIIACGKIERKIDETHKLVDYFYENYKCREGLRLDENGLFVLLPEITYESKRIDLRKRNIGCIEKNTFKKFKKLEELEISWNEITELDEQLFSENTVLKKVYLGSNKLIYLAKNAFKSNTMLTNLHLDHNQLNHIDKDTFKGLNSLKHLLLYENQIESIDRETFSENINLNTLKIHKNKITYLPENLFKENTKLERLDIDQNQITSLPENLLKENINLKTLYTDRNQITSLPENLFKENTKLEKLWIYANQITSLPENLFKENTELKRIEIQANQITSLPKNLFKENTKLEKLSINDNQFQSLPENLLKEASNLNDFHIDKFIQFEGERAENLDDEAKRKFFNYLGIPTGTSLTILDLITSTDHNLL